MTIYGWWTENNLLLPLFLYHLHGSSSPQWQESFCIPILSFLWAKKGAASLTASSSGGPLPFVVRSAAQQGMVAVLDGGSVQITSEQSIQFGKDAARASDVFCRNKCHCLIVMATVLTFQCELGSAEGIPWRFVPSPKGCAVCLSSCYGNLGPFNVSSAATINFQMPVN